MNSVEKLKFSKEVCIKLCYGGVFLFCCFFSEEGGGGGIGFVRSGLMVLKLTLCLFSLGVHGHISPSYCPFDGFFIWLVLLQNNFCFKQFIDLQNMSLSSGK